MAIIRYPRFTEFGNPFAEMEKIKREMDRLFAGAMGRGPLAMGSGVFPALNVYEDADKIHIEAELPGFRPEDIDISVEKNTLTLRGERKEEALENVSYHRRERRTGRFHKALTLPYDVSADNVDANFKNGVLKLVLPKAEHAKPKKISIKSE
jgi:HSP20 family protein